MPITLTGGPGLAVPGLEIAFGFTASPLDPLSTVTWTTGVNAAVTGLGPTRRVVLFDTLLDGCSRDEVRVVVAHELSHVRHRDVPRALAFSAFVAGPAALAVAELSGELSPDRRSPTIPALALAYSVVSGPVGMIARRLSRAIERRADAESLRLSGNPDAFIAFQRAASIWLE